MKVTCIYGAGADKSICTSAFLGGRFLIESLKNLDSAYEDDNFKETAEFIGSNRYRFDWKKYVKQMLKKKLDNQHVNILKGKNNHQHDIGNISILIDNSIWEKFTDSNRSIKYKQLIIQAILHITGAAQINNIQNGLIDEVKNSLEKNIDGNIQSFFDNTDMNINIDPSENFIKVCINVLNNYIYNNIDDDALEIVSFLLDYSQLIDSEYTNIAKYRPFNNNSYNSKGAVIRSLHFIYGLYYAINSIEISERNDDNYYDIIKNYSTYRNSFSHITLNYTSFISDILTDAKIIYLHGKINEYLNLKDREIINQFEESAIPNIVPQTTIKPMVSFEMIKRYTDAYNLLNNSDLILSIGFGFQNDDSHVVDIIKKSLREKPANKLVVYAGSDIFTNKIINDIKYEFPRSVLLYDREDISLDERLRENLT